MKHRDNAYRRGYDRDWFKLRDRVVIESGCKCQMCGCPVVLRKREATARIPVAHVDHIKSIEEAPELRLERSNLRCLCERCHNARTARDQGFHKGKDFKPKTVIGDDGYPVNPDHHWNDE